MKQFIVNELDGGFVVQTVENGQPQGPGAIKTNYNQVMEAGADFFALRGLEVGRVAKFDEPPFDPDDIVSGEGYLEQSPRGPQVSPPEPPVNSVRRRGRPLGSKNVA